MFKQFPAAIFAATILCCSTMEAGTITIGSPGDSGGNTQPFGSLVPTYLQVYSSSFFAAPTLITGITFTRTNVAHGVGSDVITSATYAFSFSNTLKAVDGLDNSDLNSNVGPNSESFFTGFLSGTPSTLTITGKAFLYDPALGNLLLRIDETGGVCCGKIFFDARNGSAAGAFSRADGFAGTAGFGLVTTFTTGAVPEPSSLWPILSGLAGLFTLKALRRTDGSWR